MPRTINAMEAKFIAFLQSDPEQNATQAAIKAGYSKKSCGQIGWQLLQRPRIKAEMDAWKASKRKEMSKSDYIDCAIKDYRELDVTEPNKPRFLDIAGKALGYIGANPGNTITNQTLNINQVNLDASQSDMWSLARKLIGND